MAVFTPNLTTLPAPQRALWSALGTTPKIFTLYGGTALALRLAHRTSVDFDFFSNASFNPDQLASQVPYLKNAERIQVAPDTLTCRVERDGAVLVSFFGRLGLGQVAAKDHVLGGALQVASLLDLAGTKVKVLQERAEVKDYLDVDALLRHGVERAVILGAAASIYGPSFNPLITLKALCYFDDVPALPLDVRARLAAAATALDVTRLPTLTPFARRPAA